MQAKQIQANGKASQAKASQAKARQAKPSQAKPSQGKARQAKPRPRPGQAKPRQKPMQAKPSQAKPRQAKARQAKARQAKPSQGKASASQAKTIALSAKGSFRPEYAGSKLHRTAEIRTCIAELSVFCRASDSLSSAPSMRLRPYLQHVPELPPCGLTRKRMERNNDIGIEHGPSGAKLHLSISAHLDKTSLSSPTSMFLSLRFRVTVVSCLFESLGNKSRTLAVIMRIRLPESVCIALAVSPMVAKGDPQSTKTVGKTSSALCLFLKRHTVEERAASQDHSSSMRKGGYMPMAFKIIVFGLYEKYTSGSP